MSNSRAVRAPRVERVARLVLISPGHTVREYVRLGLYSDTKTRPTWVRVYDKFRRARMAGLVDYFCLDTMRYLPTAPARAVRSADFATRARATVCARLLYLASAQTAHTWRETHRVLCLEYGEAPPPHVSGVGLLAPSAPDYARDILRGLAHEHARYLEMARTWRNISGRAHATLLRLAGLSHVPSYFDGSAWDTRDKSRAEAHNA